MQKGFIKKLQEAKWITRETNRYGSTPYPPMCIWHPVKFGEIKKAWSASSLKNISMYVHIPFCASKCSFCGHPSFVETSPEAHDQYIGCLEEEIRLLELGKRLPVRALRLAGGTPTVLGARQLERLCKILMRRFDFSNSVGKIVEVSAHTAAADKMRILADYGFDRVTIGVQTTDEKILRRLNRVQGPESVADAYSAVRKSGVKYVNVDIMAGLPGQSVSSFVKTLNFVISLKPDLIHINPFIPFRICRFGADKVTAEMIKLRSKMAGIGPDIIARKLPLALDHSRWSDIENDFYSGQMVFSTLGLGYSAISHALGSLFYITAGKYSEYIKSLQGSVFPPVVGYRLNKNREMRAYVTQVLDDSSQIPKQRFREIFNAGLEDIFSEEIALLAGNGLLENNRDYLEIPDCLPPDAGRTILARFFYEKDVWRRVLRSARRKGCLRKSIDEDFLCFSPDP